MPLKITLQMMTEIFRISLWSSALIHKLGSLGISNSDLLSSSSADVVDGLMVGADHLYNTCKDKKNLKEKHILLVSNLCGPVDECDLSKLTESLQSSGIKFSLIGCDLSNPESTSSSEIQAEPGPSHSAPCHPNYTQKVSPHLSYFTDLWSRLDGESYDFNDAVSALRIFETRTVSQRGWKVDFQIGDSLVIPVIGYTQIKEAHAPTMKVLYAPDPSVPLRTATKYYKRDESSSELNSSEVTRGHRYGGTLVPFGEEDMASLKPSSEKSLSVIGFTEASNVPHNFYTGESVLVFVAQTTQPVEDSTANTPMISTALAALAQALYEVGGVVLVRRVYNQTSAARLGVLTPEVQGNQISLVYTDLAYLTPQRIPNPWIQRFFACLRERGLNPSVPLPTSTNSLASSHVCLSPEMFPGLEEIITRISPDSETASVVESRNILLKSLPSLRQPSDSVDLVEKYVAKRRRLMEEELYGSLLSTSKTGSNDKPLSNSNSCSQNASISNSSQINSVHDFEDLLSQQQTELACRLMEAHIIQLVTDPFTANLLRPKAIACLFAYRKHAQLCIEEKSNTSDITSTGTDDSWTNRFEIAQAYNSFIRQWRQDLIDRNLLGSGVSSTSSVCDNRLSFWRETITQGMRLHNVLADTFYFCL
ncbi:unnamed protein product [Heterobilharzia americana]|nr:unnamed protein product [Heterobilharzia americana]